MKIRDVSQLQKPEVNIGTVGHVDHGKTTLVKALSGKWTDTHSEEIKRGITIRLGYADAAFSKCTKCNVYTTREKCPGCSGDVEFLRTVSFIDAPGHESLMATMLSGTALIDGAMLLIAANEKCPQPQTREHLMALKISGIKNVVVVQNKIDLVSREEALQNYRDICSFLKDTPYTSAPIIPISAQHGVNLSELIEALQENIPTPEKDPAKPSRFFVARSFDINLPGSDPVKIKGGVLGGALVQGRLRVGEEIEIRPGRRVEKEGRVDFEPLSTTVESIMTGGKSVEDLTPGGSAGMLTKLDPSIVKSDKLSGSVVGAPGQLPPVWKAINLEVNLLQRVVGSREELNVEPVKLGEALMLNINSTSSVGIVSDIRKKTVTCKLKIPICAEPGSRLTISRRILNRFRLIGYGILGA